MSSRIEDFNLKPQSYFYLNLFLTKNEVVFRYVRNLSSIEETGYAGSLRGRICRIIQLIGVRGYPLHHAYLAGEADPAHPVSLLWKIEFLFTRVHCIFFVKKKMLIKAWSQSRQNITKTSALFTFCIFTFYPLMELLP